MNAWRLEDTADGELGESLDTLRFAISAARATRHLGSGDLPSPPEIRQLLRLFAKLPSYDTRQAILTLLHVIVDAS